ncbi:hypothetical protein K6Q96_10890 [Grimontia kaedaensis]|uniref:Lipoprotein n=1 Tax=Grimontia kaedaensis TaxID=2872157 RepID=A0ABY4WPA4_9GAMM|nr:hypothetical protein [Grimontia kaedaensis]USH01418.1 hypothetical protein K6Q96_10890 [Grimontia kaedaensis]
MKNLVLTLFSVLLVVSCGGGSGSGGGADNNGSNSGILPLQSEIDLYVTTENRYASFNLPIEVSIPESTSEVYLYVGSNLGSSSGISNLSLSIFLGGESNVSFDYYLPESNPGGDYKEVLTLYFCYDENCNSTIEGSPFDITLNVNTTLPTISNSTIRSYTVKRRIDDPTEMVFDIIIPIENSHRSSNSYVEFSGDASFSVIQCPFNSDRTEATCPVTIESLNTMSYYTMDQGYTLSVNLCYADYCFGSNSDNILISVMFESEQLSTISSELPKTLVGRYDEDNHLTYSRFYNAFIYYGSSSETNRNLMIKPVNGGETIIIPLRPSIFEKLGKIHVDDGSGQIFYLRSSDDRSALYKLTPDLNSPQESITIEYINSVPSPSDALFKNDSLFLSYTNQSYSDSHLTEIKISTGNEIKRNSEISTSEVRRISLTSLDGNIFSGITESRKNTIVRFREGNIEEQDINSIEYPYSYECNEILSTEDIILNRCGRRFEKDSSNNDIMVEIEPIPRPSWFDHENEEENRFLVSALKMDFGNYIYVERSRKDCVDDCVNYLTIANKDNSEIQEFFLPSSLSIASGLHVDKDGSLWVSGKSSLGYLVAQKVMLPQ